MFIQFNGKAAFYYYYSAEDHGTHISSIRENLKLSLSAIPWWRSPHPLQLRMTVGFNMEMQFRCDLAEVKETVLE